MRYPTVFMDVDGVLADLWGALYKAHGISYDPLDPTLPVGEKAYFLNEVLGISWEDLWIPYAEHYVTTMEKLPEADAIMGIVNPPEREWGLSFLTKPLPNRLNGRYTWLKKYYPGIPVIIADVKTFCCAGPESLLIDDFDKNVRAWRLDGGSAIHFPRRWNSRYHEISGFFPEKFIEEFESWKSTVFTKKKR